MDGACSNRVGGKSCSPLVRRCYVPSDFAQRYRPELGVVGSASSAGTLLEWLMVNRSVCDAAKVAKPTT